MNRVLVTGGTGFVGANLVRAVAEAGDEVHLLVRATSTLRNLGDALPRVRTHVGDLLGASSVRTVMREVEPSVVYHLAAASGHPRTPGERAEALRTDTVGTLNLLQTMSGGERLVYLGSNLEYGSVDGPVAEDAPIRPTSYRGVAKASSTLLVQQFALAEGQPTTIIRPFHVYGPREPSGRVVPTFLRALLEDRPIALPAGGQGRDFVFVGDLVEACLRAPAIARVPAEVVNVGSGELTTIKRLVSVLEEILAVTANVLPSAYPTAGWDEGRTYADIAMAARILAWEPRHTLREGLAETAAWWRSRLLVPA